MDKQPSTIRIELTDEQTRQIQQTCGTVVSALEFNVQELEDRIAPLTINFTSVPVTYSPQKA